MKISFYSLKLDVVFILWMMKWQCIKVSRIFEVRVWAELHKEWKSRVPAGPVMSYQFPFLNLKKAKWVCFEKIGMEKIEITHLFFSFQFLHPALLRLAILPRVTELIRGKTAIWTLQFQSSFDDSSVKYFNTFTFFFIAIF